MDRETLDMRIDARVATMWQRGFVDEVETLINRGLLEGKTAQAAIGYAQIIKLKHGEMTEQEAMEDTARATRQYARRQETWFSRDQRIQWIKPGTAAERLSTALASL